MAGDNEDEISFYDYEPSEIAAAVFTIIFAISFLYTTFQIFRRRSWVWIIFLVAIGMEVLGFAARFVSARDQDAQGPFAISFLLILLAPVLMAGVIYALFGRIVFWVMPPDQRTVRVLWVPARFITLIFVGLDIVSLLLQAIAGALVAGTDVEDEDAQEKFDLGQTLGITGVAVQLIGFGLFTIIAIRFHFTSQKADEGFARTNMARWGIAKHWKALFLTMNFTCILILIRSCFRMVEFTETGGEGGVHSEEWYLYVLDAVPVVLTVLAYNAIFPGVYLKHLGFRLPKHARTAAVDPEGTLMKAWNPQGQASQDPMLLHNTYPNQSYNSQGYYGLSSHEAESYRPSGTAQAYGTPNTGQQGWRY